MNALNVLSAQLTHDLFAIAKFLYKYDEKQSGTFYLGHGVCDSIALAFCVLVAV